MDPTLFAANALALAGILILAARMVLDRQPAPRSFDRR